MSKRERDYSLIVELSHIILFRSQVFSNSNKHNLTVNQDSSGRLPMNPGINTSSTTSNTLPISTRAQPGRFGTVNPTGSFMHSTNEQIPRSTNISSRTYQSHFTYNWFEFTIKQRF